MKKGEKMPDWLKNKVSKSRKGKNIGNKNAEGNKPNKTSFKKGMTPWIKGKRHSLETKKKMSQNSNHIQYWLGKKRDAKTIEKLRLANLGRLAWNKGKSWSLEMKKKLSDAHIGKNTGESHYNWNGGITPLYQQIRTCFEYRRWRSDVFTRDNFICQICGDDKGGNLNADHIKKFTTIIKQYKIKTLVEAKDCEELWNINNGRTLCIDCHRKTETYGNNKKNI